MKYSEYSKEQLLAEKAKLEEEYKNFKSKGLKLDMSRGKPSPEQLDLRTVRTIIDNIKKII